MIFLKTEDEIELLRQSNLLVGKTLAEVAKMIKPGVTTKELDKVAEEFIRDNGAIPTFKGFPNQFGVPFPASICTSVNDQVVHGIPNDIPLKDGDIVSVDCGTYMNGFCGDSCYTFPVGNVSPEVMKLLKVTKEALYKGIENAFLFRCHALQTLVRHRTNLPDNALQPRCQYHQGVSHELHSLFLCTMLLL